MLTKEFIVINLDKMVECLNLNVHCKIQPEKCHVYGSQTTGTKTPWQNTAMDSSGTNVMLTVYKQVLL